MWLGVTRKKLSTLGDRGVRYQRQIAGNTLEMCPMCQEGQIEHRTVPGRDHTRFEVTQQSGEICQHLRLVTGEEVIMARCGQADRSDRHDSRVDGTLVGVDLDVEPVGN